jgi:hypothetical protein
MMSRMMEHVLFHYTHPQMVSLRKKNALLFPQAGSQDVSAFLYQENNKLHTFIHDLVLLHE